jgi:hypothetical protein
VTDTEDEMPPWENDGDKVAGLKAENERLRNQVACAVAGLENDLENNRDLADARWRRTADERCDGEAFAYEEAANLVASWFKPVLDGEGDS